MKEPEIILQKLEDRFVPERNILYERYVFHNTKQQVHESIDQFVIKLRQLAKPCHFGALDDEMVRDQFILGYKDSAAITRPFREKDCTHKKAIESLYISEATSEQPKKIEQEDNPDAVSYVEKEDKRKQKALKPASQLKTDTLDYFKKEVECKFCGDPMKEIKCLAFGKMCHQCGKANHFLSVCLQKQGVHLLDEESSGIYVSHGNSWHC